jgi:3-oxoacyl-(acyl-carrier-protein) synthase/NAD(P)-dependent dehydrogenase (short-subunit alcohol dehydrogenase family)
MARALIDPLEATQVAVVGIGIAVPNASNPQQFWELIQTGSPVFREARRFNVDSFWSAHSDAEDRGYSRVGGFIDDLTPHPRVAAELSQGRLSEQDSTVVWLRHCIAQAVDGVAITDSDRCTSYFGGSVDTSQQAEETTLVQTVAHGMVERLAVDQRATELTRLRARLSSHYRNTRPRPVLALPDRVIRAAVAGLLPNETTCVVVDAACASSLYGLDLAVRDILAGESTVTCCGGFFAVTPRYNMLFAKLNGLSPTGRVRVFDDAADGTVFSDGAAALVLKRLDRARTDGDSVLGVLAGIGLSSDGAGKAIYAPNPAGQRLCVQRAHRMGDTTRPDWVVAHGTGTPAGDSVELSVLGELAGPHGYPCTSPKSIIGHTGWSAGAVSVILALLALRHNSIPAQRPVVHSAGDGHNSAVWIPSMPVTFPLSPEHPRTVGISAFGFGGSNAHVLIQDRPTVSGHAQTAVAADDPAVLVAWSAHLPGAPSHDEVSHMLAAAQIPNDARRFGATYRLPDFAECGLPPPTLRAIDRGHLMALQVAARFATEHGKLWRSVATTTGVVAAQLGPSRLSMDNLVRCYAADLTAVFSGSDSEAFAETLATVRRRVGPSCAASLPGIFPNILAGRLANRYDLHGPAMLVDTGRSSGCTAARVALRYLQDGAADLMLVIGVNANHGADFAELVGVEAESIREGAFLLALSRSSTARANGWPVIAELTATTEPEPRALPVPSAVGEGSWLAADGLAAIVRASLLAAPIAAVLPPDGERGRVINVRTVPQRTYPYRVDIRFNARYDDRPLQSAVPSRCLVIVGPDGVDEALTRLLHQTGGELVIADPTRTSDAMLAAVGHTRASGQHIRVVCSLHDSPWPAAPEPWLVHLHDMAFAAAAHHRDRLCAEGTFGFVLLDPLIRDRLHPHAALFTGLAKPLAWELSGCTVFAVATDATSPSRGIEQMASAWPESDFAPVVRVRAGHSITETLVPLRRAEPAADRPQVVVAAGGARGITAACLNALAHLCRPVIWLLGSSDLDAAREYPRELSLDTVLQMHPELSVPQARRHLTVLRAARESGANLDDLRKVCGAEKVNYLQCDLTDYAAVHRAADHIRIATPAIDLLIHAAGISRPATVATKSLDDFRSVRDTKLLGYHHLKRAFADPAPRRWCNFGSIVGITGLPGETDYAAANEFLAAAAAYGNGDGATTEFTLAWPPWAETGLNSHPLAAAVRERLGLLTAIDTHEGVEHFLDELFRRPGESPVVTWLGDRERDMLTTRIPGLVCKNDNDVARGIP